MCAVLVPSQPALTELRDDVACGMGLQPRMYKDSNHRIDEIAIDQSELRE